MKAWTNTFGCFRPEKKKKCEGELCVIGNWQTDSYSTDRSFKQEF